MTKSNSGGGAAGATPDRLSRTQMRRTLAERVAGYVAQIKKRGLASDAELAEYIPANLKRAGDWQLVWAHAQCVRFLGRQELREVGADAAAADAVALRTLRSDPVDVALSTNLVVQVHPKSLHALIELHKHDEALSYLVVRREMLARRDAAGKTPEHVALLARVLAEIEYQLLLLAWMATSPGPGLPFADDAFAGDERPEIPLHLRDLSPADVLLVHRAFVEVNTTRLQVLDRLVEPPKAGPRDQRVSWSVFVSRLALKWNGRVESLMRDHALAALLATAKLGEPPAPDEPPEA